MGVNPPALQRRKSAGAYLVYQINKGLSLIPRELFDHLDLIAIREDRCDLRNALMLGKGVGDELFPCRGS